jgi:hypothetical protein
MAESRNYTEAQLDKMTAKQIKKIAVEAGCTGIYKLGKEDAVQYFMNWQDERDEERELVSEISDPLAGVSGRFQTTSATPSRTAAATVQVSCGANAGPFEVIGRSIAEVSNLLREVLNIEVLATPLVNGRAVSGTYVLKTGDSLEFLKPAGRKGF